MFALGQDVRNGVRRSIRHSVRRAVALAVFAAVLLSLPGAIAKTKNIRKVQEVDFDEMSLKGTIRNPDGAYLVQKRGMKFMPLHEVKRNLDSRIRDSGSYVK